MSEVVKSEGSNGKSLRVKVMSKVRVEEEKSWREVMSEQDWEWSLNEVLGSQSLQQIDGVASWNEVQESDSQWKWNVPGAVLTEPNSGLFFFSVHAVKPECMEDYLNQL